MDFLYNILCFFKNLFGYPDDYQSLQQDESTPPQSPTHTLSQIHGNHWILKHYGPDVRNPRNEEVSRNPRYMPDGGRKSGTSQLEKHKEEIRAQLSKLQHERKQLQSAIDDQEHVLGGLRREEEAQTHSNKLLITRQRELQMANSSINTRDTFSPIHFKDRIAKLNQALYAVSTTAISNSEPSTNAKGDKETISQLLGDGLVRSIPLLRGKQESILVLRMILQIFLCQRLHIVLESWSTSAELDQFLNDRLYYHIVHTEEQEISGKWREMTHKGLQIDSSEWLRDHAQMVSDSFFQILLFAGRQTTKNVEERIINEIQGLFRYAYEINTEMKSGPISHDLHPITPRFSKPFNQDTMLDCSKKFGMSVEGVEQPLHVLGTTEIGLKVCVKGRRISSFEGNMNAGVVLWEGIAPLLKRRH